MEPDKSELATPPEVPTTVLVEGKFWLRFEGREVQLPPIADDKSWVINKDDRGLWMISDGQRVKRVTSLLALARARDIVIAA